MPSKYKRIILGSLVFLGGGAFVSHDWDAVGEIVSLLRTGVIGPLESPATLNQPAPVPVTIAKARAEDVPIYLSGIGTVQAFSTVAVKSRVDGEIIQVLFLEGQDVKMGDPLAVIDQRPFVAQLAQAKAQRAKDEATVVGAQLDLDRYSNLVTKDFASRQQVDQQRATVDAARAQVLTDEAQIAYAQTQLDYTTIRSPIGGRVGIRQIDQGNFVHSSDTSPLVTITQLQPISVIFTLPAGAVAQSRLVPGEVHVPVTAFGPDDVTKLDEGTVELVDNTVDSTTGTIKLKASFPNTGLRLWPGTFVNGRLVVETRKEAITVPEDALRHGPRGDFVWLVQKDSTVVTRNVTAGQVDRGRVLVERGLDRGAEVVTEGHFRLDEHQKVDVVRNEDAPSPPKAAAPAAANTPG